MFTFKRMTSSDSLSDSSKTQCEIQFAMRLMPWSICGCSRERNPYMMNFVKDDKAAEVSMPFP